MRAVFFDVDGVLVHGYHTDYEKRRRWDQHLEADLGIDPEVFTQRFIRTVFHDEVLSGAKSLVSAMEEARVELGFGGSPMSIISYWINRDTQLNHPLLNGIRRLKPDQVRLLIATNQEHLRAFHLSSSACSTSSRTCSTPPASALPSRTPPSSNASMRPWGRRRSRR